jgi:hypothetical protein
MNRHAEFSDLQGKTLVKIIGLQNYSDDVFFETKEGPKYQMVHHQD